MMGHGLTIFQPVLLFFFLSKLSFWRAARVKELFFDKVQSACNLPERLLLQSLNGSFLIPAVGNRLSNKLFCSLILYKSSLPADPWLSHTPIQKLGILILLHLWVKQICITATALWPAGQLQTETLVYISVSALLLINNIFICFQLRILGFNLQAVP